jgi:riboflavin synthase
MFTGLIQDIGKIQTLEPQRGGLRLTVSTRLDLGSLRLGDSVSVDGVCLTVVKLAGSSFTLEVSLETLRKTTLSAAKQGQLVNLEMPLKMSDPLGGHLVSGHVDGTGEIREVLPEGNSLRYRFGVPEEIGRYLVEKGSVAVDGISLTVLECQEGEFSVSVIPHTARATTLGQKKAGDRVNLENDMIAKYVEKFVRQRESPEKKTSKIDAAFLAEHGFRK